MVDYKLIGDCLSGIYVQMRLICREYKWVLGSKSTVWVLCLVPVLHGFWFFI